MGWAASSSLAKRVRKYQNLLTHTARDGEITMSCDLRISAACLTGDGGRARDRILPTNRTRLRGLPSAAPPVYY